MATFGNENVEGSSTYFNNSIFAEVGIATEGSIESITAYLNASSANRKVVMGLYRASDDSLVAQTEEYTLPQGWQWHTVYFAAPVAVNTESYYLAVSASGSFNVQITRSSLAGKGRYRGVAYSAIMPNPSGTSINNFTYSVFATYEEAAEPASPIKVRVGGSFASAATKVKVGGTFINATTQIKSGGTFS